MKIQMAEAGVFLRNYVYRKAIQDCFVYKTLQNRNTRRYGFKVWTNYTFQMEIWGYTKIMVKTSTYMPSHI